MKIQSSLSKIVPISGFIFCLFITNCTNPFKQRTETVKKEFIVSSLDSSGQNRITLTISIDPNNNAKISRKVVKAGPNDVHSVYIVGDSLHSTGSSIDTAEIEITGKRAGSQRFWVDINQTTPILINEGGDVFKFFCYSEYCIKNVSSVPNSTATQNMYYISCTQSCMICKLKHFISPGLIVEGGGVYIYANSVTYQ